MPNSDTRATDRRTNCQAGRHVATVQSIRIDAIGLEHSHCRYCGCKLARNPSVGRWYVCGLMGEPPT